MTSKKEYYSFVTGNLGLTHGLPIYVMTVSDTDAARDLRCVQSSVTVCVDVPMVSHASHHIIIYYSVNRP